MPLSAQTGNNIAAHTGFGQFNLQLVPAGGAASILNVVVNLRYVDRRTAPTSTTAGFAAAHAAAVSAYWNNKIKFGSTQGDVTVRFVVNCVVAGGHFAVRIKDGAYGAGSGLKFATATDDPCGVGTDNLYLDLNDGDCLPYYLGNKTGLATGVINPDRMGLLMNERNRVVGAAPGAVTTVNKGAVQQDFFDVPLVRTATGGWSVDPAAQPGLDAFCAAIATTPDWLSQPQLVIHATSGLDSKLTGMISAVETYVRRLGITGPVSRDPNKVRRKFRMPFSGHKQAANVRIEVADTLTMVRNWQSRYCVAAHEFGHCIGLPDEYLDYSTFTNSTIRDSQPRWDALCTPGQANVAPRNWHAQFNESMMSIGDRLYPCHAATLWKALDDMTQLVPNKMAAQSWSVLNP